MIEIYIHTYDAHDVEIVMADGKKENFTKGRIWIEFKGYVTYDPEKRWESKRFYARLRNFYNKYVIKKKMEGVWWDLLWYREIHRLVWLVKQRLKMEADSYEHKYWIGVHR